MSRRRCAVLLGSNIEKERNLPAAIALLGERCGVVAVSSVYESAPVGGRDQPSFWNAAVLLETELPPRALKWEVLRPIETALGRVRTEDRYAARVIDLDIVFYGEECFELDGGPIPDPDILEFAHVALPVAEIAPTFVHPAAGLSLSEIASRFADAHGVRRVAAAAGITEAVDRDLGEAPPAVTPPAWAEGTIELAAGDARPLHDQLAAAALDRSRPPIGPSVYDTSWLLRLDGGDAAAPDLIASLVARQHADGSWGARVPLAHDRTLTTLAMVVALARGGRDFLPQSRAGAEYISRHLHLLDGESERTAGFELLLPAFVAEAQELGVALPYDRFALFERERRAKLDLLPRGALFRTITSALFSLEAFRDAEGVESAADLLLEDGSMHCSPSATAFLMSRFPDWRTRFPTSARYLDGLGEACGGLPEFAPSEVMMSGWTLEYLHHGGLLRSHSALAEPHYDLLERAWRPEGVSWSDRAGMVPDADDTAMLLTVLRRAGRELDGSVLLGYEREAGFASMAHERNGSVTVNLHILQALPCLPAGARDRVRDKTLSYVFGQRREGAFWTDKWHASPLYPTTRALMLLPAHAPGRLRPTVEWLIARQRPDGGWGHRGSTIEETGLVLLALLHYFRAHPKEGREQAREPLDRAADYLAAADFGAPLPELWIAKVNYAPVPVVAAAVAGALALYEEMLGRGARRSRTVIPAAAAVS